MNHKGLIVILLIAACWSPSWGQGDFSVWASAGLGVTNHQYNDSHFGLSGSWGVGLRYDWLSFKFKRGASSEFHVLNPGIETRSYEFLLGYSYRFLALTGSEAFVSLYLGGASVEEQTPRLVFSGSGAFSDRYEMVSQFAASFPVELEIEVRPFRFFSLSCSVFSNISKFTPIHGVQLNVLVGYW